VLQRCHCVHSFARNRSSSSAAASMAPAGASNSKGSSGGGGGGAGAGAGAPPAVGGGDDQQCAYAKLWGRTGVLQTEFTAFVKSLPCRLGRIPPSAVGDDGFVDQIPDDFVHLGNDKSISRHHATIDWLADAGGYMITCHSKNGIVVDKMWKSKDGQSETDHRVWLCRPCSPSPTLCAC
jgi:hypothetical protein